MNFGKGLQKFQVNNQKIEDFMSKNKISEKLLFCETLTEDGNRTIGIMEDENHYYMVRYYTS